MTRGQWCGAMLALAAGWLVSTAQAADALKIEKRTLAAKSPVYEIEAAYPRTGVKAIDAELADWVEHAVADFKQQADPDPDVPTGPWTLHIDYEVVRNDAQVFAVRFDDSTYTGGAHPSNDIRTFNYLRPDGQRLDLAQLLDGAKGLARLSQLVVADLTRQLEGPDAMTDVEWIRRGAGPDWANFENFLLLPDALRIEFPQYQVAAYAAGPQSVRIPLAALRPVMRADWRAPVASFDCAKAATPVEHAICADAALARLDREVARVYAERLAGADAAADKQAIRAAQRGWLGRRDAACKPADAALGACLADLYRTRLAELSASR